MYTVKIDSATDLSDEVLETVPRQLGVTVDVRLRQVRPQNVHAHLEIGLVEVVGHVPAQLSVLAPLLDDGVEESEDEDERLKSWVWTLGQRGGIDLQVRASHVQLQSIRRLRYDLYGVIIPAQIRYDTIR